MAFSDEALKAKLVTLNETQDSIVSVSQWITFHKRHSDRIANLWLTRLRDSPPAKRLNFIYLVNDIVQNARARKRTEFPDSFAPLMPEAIETAYRSSTPEIQTKLRRVLEVWKTRVTFESAILEAIETRLDNVDKSKGGSSSGKKTLMGKSLFGSSSDKPMPKELESLGPLQIAVTKAALDSRPTVDSAQKEYSTLFDPEAALPTPPVYAAKLSGLLKQLNQAQTALATSIKARTDLVADLGKILEANKSALAKEQGTLSELAERKDTTEAKKRDVEDAIMRGLSSSDDVDAADSNGAHGYDRPEVEALTPEPEAPPAADLGMSDMQANNPAIAAALSGFGDAVHTPGKIRQASSSSLNGQSAKRRKMSHGDDRVVPDLGAMGMENFGREGESAVGSPLDNLDADVNELLESAKQG